MTDLSNPPFWRRAGGICLLPEQAGFSNPGESTAEFAWKSPAAPIIHFYDGNLGWRGRKEAGRGKGLKEKDRPIPILLSPLEGEDWGEGVWNDL